MQTLQEMWDEFNNDVLYDLPAEQRRWLRRVFTAGCFAMFTTLTVQARLVIPETAEANRQQLLADFRKIRVAFRENKL